jgi:hypothetical protein
MTLQQFTGPGDRRTQAVARIRPHKQPGVVPAAEPRAMTLLPNDRRFI